MSLFFPFFNPLFFFLFRLRLLLFVCLFVLFFLPGKTILTYQITDMTHSTLSFHCCVYNMTLTLSENKLSVLQCHNVYVKCHIHICSYVCVLMFPCIYSYIAHHLFMQYFTMHLTSYNIIS